MTIKFVEDVEKLVLRIQDLSLGGIVPIMLQNFIIGLAEPYSINIGYKK